jgi:hypothetical protein
VEPQAARLSVAEEPKFGCLNRQTEDLEKTHNFYVWLSEFIYIYQCLTITEEGGAPHMCTRTLGRRNKAWCSAGEGFIQVVFLNGMLTIIAHIRASDCLLDPTLFNRDCC